MTDPAALDRRLDRLELENRRLRRLTAVCLAGMFGWAACSTARPAVDTVRAQRFVLVDGSGAELGALELDGGGFPMLHMKHGKAQAVVTANGPGLLFRGLDGKTTAYMGIDSNLTSKLELSSERLMDGVRLSTRADGSCGVYVLDSTGRERGGLEASSLGGANLTFKDTAGHLRGHVGLDVNDLPSLLLMDEAGARRLGAMVLGDGTPLLEVQDAESRPRVQLTTIFDGTPSLDLFREDGGTSFRAP
jgi:hypothetical protein